MEPMREGDPLFAPMVGAVHEDFAGIQTDAVTAGRARVKRLIYPVGTRWSTHVKPVVGGDWCMHAHVGFLAQGHIKGEYADRCGFDFTAPRVFVIEPGHDAWVVGDEPAVVIEFDAEGETARRFGLPERHRHA